jgi:molybdopterin-binding protein
MEGGERMKLSARNVLKGTVKAIDIGAVNAEVAVEVAPDLVMTSIITKKSCENLDLEVGKEAYVIIKASNVMIGTE